MANKPEYWVIDNFLDKEDFKQIQDFILGPAIPWNYNKSKVSESEKEAESKDSFQFVHLFYNTHIIKSDHFNILNPLIKKINPLAIIKIKANMTMRTEELLEYGYHKDLTTDTGLLTAVFYLNNNNGYTKFIDGIKVESIENRIVIFDSQAWHTGTSCTDERFRAVLNLNYYPFGRV